ncbi:unnamed protein product [Caenorhabditis bovis]|uniref:STI1 domain-containing protein n=1 Tax=Caenorhabditis bovis TaxID=2654633 RepID=A0A8S1EL50_9PELO|nr:unnamed protein product [Caenorhabditis bovis]
MIGGFVWLRVFGPTAGSAHKIQEYNRAVERQKEEIELAERRERVRRAQEANRKAAEEAAKHQQDDDDFDFSSMGGGAPGGGNPAFDLFNDPEITEALKDPEVLPALMDIMKNPANLMKYVGNPKVAALLAKMQAKGGMPGMFGGPSSGGCPGGECNDSGCKPAPSKAPEPDLD